MIITVISSLHDNTPFLFDRVYFNLNSSGVFLSVLHQIVNNGTWKCNYSLSAHGEYEFIQYREMRPSVTKHHWFGFAEFNIIDRNVCKIISVLFSAFVLSTEFWVITFSEIIISNAIPFRELCQSLSYSYIIRIKSQL